MSKKKKCIVLIIYSLLTIIGFVTWILTHYSAVLGIFTLMLMMTVIMTVVSIKNEMLAKKILPWEIGTIIVLALGYLVYFLLSIFA